MSDETAPSLPVYERGIPIADKQQAKPLIKMIAAKFLKLPRGKISPQSIHIKHKKKKESRVTYW